jgi:hypothetical protein
MLGSIVNNELERILKEVVVAKFAAYPGIRLEELRKTMTSVGWQALGSRT